MIHQNDTILQTEELSIGYKSKSNPLIIQTKLNIELKCGEMVCLVGPNGSGKSTLLRTIAGLQPAISGSICIQGKCIDQISVQQLALLRSIVLTNRFEFGYLSVSELVSLGRFPHLGWLGRLRTRDKHRIAEAIEQTGIAELSSRKLCQLSDGELQRAMIAKALAQESPVIMLDEPTAHLDLPNRVAIMKLLQRLAHETATAIVLSTHELDLAMLSADRFWLMSNHNSMQFGIPEDLAMKGAIAHAFNSSLVDFDTNSGTFVMKNKSRGEIGLTGIGMEYLWTKRALERIGFTVTDKYEELVIEQKGQMCNWVFYCNGQKHVCKTLSSLVEKINLEYR